MNGAVSIYFSFGRFAIFWIFDMSFLEYTNIDIIMQLVYLGNLSHLFQSIIIAAFKIQVINTSAKKKKKKKKKCWGNFRIFHFASAIHRKKKNKLAEIQQKPLYILSAMVLAYCCILPRAMIWFFNSWDYLIYLTFFVYLHKWTGEAEDNVSLVDALVLISLCVLVIVGEHIIQL